jgi:drug/metabolite transporter (DMT)-like permease
LTIAGVIFTAEVVFVRFVGNRADAAQIVFFRAAAQLAVATVWLMVAGGVALLKTDRFALHLTRGVISAVSWGLYYVSFQMLDLALATTLTFTSSLFVVLLAGPVLGERVGRDRVIATFAGFVGIVVATRVWSLGSFDPRVFIGLASAVCGAAIIFLTRALAKSEKTIAIFFYIGLITTLGTAPAAVVNWRPIGADVFALLSLAGLTGALGMWMMIEAFRHGEASALAPIPYLRLVFAVLAGWLVFSEVPHPATLVGAVIVVAAAIIVTRAERRRTGLNAPLR